MIFLQEEYSQEFMKTITKPTEKGMRIGIRTERRSSSRGVDYLLIIYGKQAQEYIIQNIEKMMCGEVAD